MWIRINAGLISYSRWSQIYTSLGESNGEDSWPTLSSFTLWCFLFILEEEERWWHWSFVFVFFLFFVLWFISWETQNNPSYFERNVLYLMLLGHLFAIIYSWKRKRRHNWWFERHILSLSHKPWKHMSHWCAAIFI